MSTGRWDFLAEQKPQLLQEYVLARVADRLAEELRAFPPALDWEDPREQARFAAVLAQPGPLARDTLRVGLELARLELLREVEAIDAFLRSPRAAELLPAPLEEQRALFVARWLTESLLEFKDFAQGKFRRRDLLALVALLEDQLVPGLQLRLSE
jgi:hypothetical protein